MESSSALRLTNALQWLRFKLVMGTPFDDAVTKAASLWCLSSTAIYGALEDKHLAESLTELLGEEVKPEALRSKARRAEAGQNDPQDPTPQDHTESEGNQEIKGN